MTGNVKLEINLTPDDDAWPISAITNLQSSLNERLKSNTPNASYFGAMFTGSGQQAKLCQNVVAQAAHATDAEIGSQVTLYASGGLAHKETAYKIAHSPSVVATAPSADIYAVNSIAHGYAGPGGHLITGNESDVNNIGQDATVLAAPTASYGYVAVSAGNKKSTAAYWATAVAQWQYGFAASTIAGGAGAIGLATFYDGAQATNVMLSDTAHQIGVNFFAASFLSGHAFIAPNNASYSSANAAGNATLGVIKLNPSDEVVVGNGASAIKAYTPYFVPGYDNAAICGSPGFKWQALYAYNGVIQTSDLRDKTDRQKIDGAVALSILQGLADDPDGLITYRWKVGGNEVTESKTGKVRVKALPGKRRHAGSGAQVWLRVLEKHNYDIGLVVKEDPKNPDSKLSKRPDQELPFVEAALIEVNRRLEEKVAMLTARIEALEKGFSGNANHQ